MDDGFARTGRMWSLMCGRVSVTVFIMVPSPSLSSSSGPLQTYSPCTDVSLYLYICSLIIIIIVNCKITFFNHSSLTLCISCFKDKLHRKNKKRNKSLFWFN